MQRLSIIVAMDRHGLIATDGRIPWDLPNDRRRFRSLTWGKPVIMGRKTWESLPVNKRPLENRLNIVLSRGPYEAPGARVVPDFVRALLVAAEHPSEDVYVMGGSSLYREALEHPWHRAYMTVVDGDFARAGHVNTYFPLEAWSQECWQLLPGTGGHIVHPPDWAHAYSYVFYTLERHSPNCALPWTERALPPHTFASGKDTHAS